MDLAKALSPKRSRRSHDIDEVVSPSGSESRRGTFRLHRKKTRGSSSKEHPTSHSDEEFFKDWGITHAEEARLLAEFKAQIEKEVGPLKPLFDTHYLTRFLRARQHDIPRAKQMFLKHLQWRQDFKIDTIVDDFQFHERDAFLTLYPQGYHKTDKQFRPIYIQHLGAINLKDLKNVTTEERMIRYHVQEYERALKYIFPACSKLAGHYIGQTLAIMDVKGVGLRHITGEVKRVLGAITRIDQDNYPETLGKTLIINAPGLFKAVWAIVKPMLDPRTQNKIELCGTDYMKELVKYVDIENIPEYLGGKSKGSLIDDVGPWQDPALLAEIDRDIVLRDKGLLDRSSLQPAESGATSMGGDSLMLHAGEHVSSRPSPFEEALIAEGVILGGGSSTLDEVTSKASQQTNGVAATGAAPYTKAQQDGSEQGDVVFYDALTVRLSSVAGSIYDTADEDYYSDALGALGSDGELDESEQGSGSNLQLPILARIRSLEEKLPAVEGRLTEHLPANQRSLSTGLGHGSVAGRVAALEKAMDTLLRAQAQASKNKSSCLGCCTVM